MCENATLLLLGLVKILVAVLLLLSTHREVIHVFLINVGLLIQSGTLSGQVTLLVRIPRIVFELGQ